MGFPSVTVTLLLADVEGSIGLWEAEREAMAEASARYGRMVRKQIEVAGGRVFAAGGEAFRAVFTDPSAALECAVAVQQAVGAEAWPPGSPVRVRVARYDGPSHYDDEASSVAVSPDGKTVFVTGYSFSVGHVEADYATLAYDAATGHQLWASRYNGPGMDNKAASLTVSPATGTVYVTGHSYGPTTGYDYATIAYHG